MMRASHERAQPAAPIDDNEVFNPVRAARGEFSVEEDGTINLGSQVPGREEGEMFTNPLQTPRRARWPFTRKLNGGGNGSGNGKRDLFAYRFS
jgi:hypothetical protein